jgi:hypothetical protein
MVSLKKIRACAALVCCGVGITWSSIGLLGQPRSYDYDAVATENRLTRLETQMTEALSQLKDIRDSQGTTQNVGYLMLLIMSGLAGEAGIRMYKKKGDE